MVNGISASSLHGQLEVPAQEPGVSFKLTDLPLLARMRIPVARCSLFKFSKEC